MEKMNDLKALLQHEVQDLISVEDQIIEAMPAMIEKAQNSALKKALQQHLSVTEKQRTRLDRVQKLVSDEQGEENKGFLSGLLNAISGGEKCKGMEGIITEGQKIMKADMDADVKDAAIIACAQKIEHYEICGYGTARAYARQLNLKEAEKLLQETLGEEYEADDRLTQLAVGDINEKAETANEGNKPSGKKAAGGGAAKSSTGLKKASAAKKNDEPKKTADVEDNKKAPKKAAAKAANDQPEKAVAKGANEKKVQNKKAAVKSSAPKKSSTKK
ncbi:MAG: hypothetical protein JWQ09_4746 [Segetibacter sp.]|nr:hypothetical protein [Segetibacter sp.]